RAADLDTALTPASLRRGRRLEAARLDPPALVPGRARRDRLQLAVGALLRHVDRVGHADHRLEADEVALLAGRRPGGPHDADLVVGAEAHVEPLRLPLHRERGAALRVAHEIAEDVVQVVVL